MKTAVLISGGVDSSVALRLLQDQGSHELTAFYLKIWLEDELAFLGDCPWEEDLSYVRQVCDQCDIPLEVLPLQTDYRERIVEYAIAQLKSGRTPSPDIQCNERIKFGEFVNRIDPSFDKVATGHYAQIREDAGAAHLFRAPDPVKDQTYFLSRLSQDQLRRALFPIGHLQKAQVRELASDFNLPTQKRRDSQGICFLGKIKFADFVRFHLGTRTGDVIDIDTGTRLGTHEGYWFFTIGQRQGLGFGGGPWYVVQKDIRNNTVFVSHADRYRERARDSLTVGDLHWIVDPPSRADLHIKLRHGPAMLSANVEPIDETRVRISMADPDAGVAPGQSAVFYDGDECLGSGVIQ